MRGIKALAANATKHVIFHWRGIYGPIRNQLAVASLNQAHYQRVT